MKYIAKNPLTTIQFVADTGDILATVSIPNAIGTEYNLEQIDKHRVVFRKGSAKNIGRDQKILVCHLDFDEIERENLEKYGRCERYTSISLAIDGVFIKTDVPMPPLNKHYADIVGLYNSVDDGIGVMYKF